MILDHIIERLAPQVSLLVLNANGDERRFTKWKLPVIRDTITQTPGPLAGIIAGMKWAAALNYSEILTVPCDTPFIPRSLVNHLGRARSENHSEIAIAASSGRLHPVIGLWPVSILGEMERAVVDEGVQSVSNFILRHRMTMVDFSGSAYDPFMNINVAADLALAEVITRRQVD